MAATRWLLGVEPLREVHIFMDAAAKRYRGAGHRLMHHDMATADMLATYYGKFDSQLSIQASREVILHIAFDRGLIQAEDVALMRDYARQAKKKSPP